MVMLAMVVQDMVSMMETALRRKLRVVIHGDMRGMLLPPIAPVICACDFEEQARIQRLHFYLLHCYFHCYTLSF